MTSPPSPALVGTGPGSLDAAVLRIFTASGSSVGLGFLVTDRVALTCAHVVAAAVGVEDDTRLLVGAEVRVDVPLLGTTSIDVMAIVEQWFPAHSSGAGDVAVLRLAAPLPGARPVRLVDADEVWGHPARAFGLPDGRPGGVWHSGVLRHRQANGWVQADLAGDGYRVAPGFSGGPVWDDEVAGVIGTMVMAESGRPPVSYLIPTSGLLATCPDLRELVLPPSPFRGLRPFVETDAAIFRGRQAESDEVARIVAGERWTTLVGPSGCGKSSLVMAGVVPLRRRARDCPVVMRPGHHMTPSHALASALLPLLEPELPETRRLTEVSNLAAELAVRGLHEIVPRVLELHDADRLLVVVDQFEELLELMPTSVDELAHVLFTEDVPDAVKVLCTLRADFLEPMLAHPRLGPVVSKRVCALEPMRPEQLREIITTPVDAIPGVRYEPNLTERILADAGTGAGALPPLGFTLDLLWEQQDRGVLTHRAYDEIGGVAGALGRYAEQAWTENTPSQDRPAAERLLTQLVRTPIGVAAALRRIAPRGELGEQEWHIAQKLAATRLLVLSGGGGAETVELAHEALLTGWDRLTRRIADQRSYLGWRESLRHDLDRWRHGGESQDLLPTATALTVAQQWLPDHADELGEAERDFLERGRAYRRTQTRRRGALFSGLALVVVMAVVFGSLFVYARGQSAENQALADSRALAEASQDAATADPALSAMTAIAAYQTAPTQEASKQLLRQYLTYAGATRVLSGMPGNIARFDTSRDGNVVLASTELGRTMLFVHAAAGTVHSEPIAAGYVVHAMVSRDGKRAGFVTEDGGAGWFDVHADAARPAGPIHRLPKVADLFPVDEGPQGTSTMSADGSLIAALTVDNVVWWDLDAGTIAGSVPIPAQRVDGLWFSPDNRTLLVNVHGAHLGDSLVAVAIATGLTRTVVAAEVDQDILVSGDRATAAVCKPRPDSTSVTQLVHVSDGAMTGRPYTSESSFCDLVAADATGRRILMGAGALTLVDLDHGTAISTLPDPLNLPTYAEDLITAGGKLLVASMVDARITYTELSTNTKELAVSDLVLSDDGTKVISLLQDGSVQLRPAASGSTRLLAEAPAPLPPWTPRKNDQLTVNSGRHLVAVRTAVNIVSVLDTTTLRQKARITTAMPPGTDDQFDYFFDRTGNLLTVAGTRVQQWDVRTGRQLAHFDTRSLQRRASDDPPAVESYPAANQVQILKGWDYGGCGSRGSPVWAKKASTSSGRYWIRLSRFFTMAASWSTPCTIRFPRLRLTWDHTCSVGLRSGA
jgi:conflict system STAND superfamily ATPase/trypsin-like peptidase